MTLNIPVKGQSVPQKVRLIGNTSVHLDLGPSKDLSCFKGNNSVLCTSIQSALHLDLALRTSIPDALRLISALPNVRGATWRCDLDRPDFLAHVCKQIESM